MSYSTEVRGAGKHRVITTLALLTLALLLTSAPALGQQKYVSRYDLFAGYTFLDSPHVSLFENGFHFQVGVRPKTWYSLGFDYSISGGSLTLTPSLLTPAWQQTIEAVFAAISAGGAASCRVHAGGAVQFPDPNLCRWAATCVSPLLESDALRSALHRSDP